MLLMPTSQTDIQPENRAADQQIPDQPVEVFFSYAHTDERLKDRLLVHFSELLRTRKISAFHPRQIVAGTTWEDEIDARLLRAQIILLLVSADFLNSNYSHDSEVRRAMQRHTAGEARVIPVILRPCDWENSSFGMLQPLPKTRKPVTSWSDRELAYKTITDGIREVLENLPSSAYTNTYAITMSSVIPAESPITGKREAFILEGEFDDFTPEQVSELLKALKQATGKGDIKIRKVEPGSIIATLEASDETMEQLKALAATGELSQILGRDFRLREQPTLENFPVTSVDNLPFDIRFAPNQSEVLTLYPHDMTGANLSGANLSGAVLRETDLTEAILRETILREADLTGANLSRAILTAANLNRAILTGANLSRANLSKAIITGANLSRALLSGADLTKVILTEAILREADLTGAILTEAILRKADLTGAILNRTNLSYTDLTGANLSYVNLAGANMYKADLAGANLTGATYYKSGPSKTIWPAGFDPIAHGAKVLKFTYP